MVEDKTPEGTKLVVYDMPADLIKQWISITKLFFDNKMWMAMAEAMDLMREKYSGCQDRLSVRLDNVETVLNALLLDRKEEPKVLTTFGGGIEDENPKT